MKFFKFLYLFPMVVLLSSCVRQDIVPLDPQKTASKLVIFGFLAPGNSIQVYVGRTLPFGKYPILKDEFKELNASVILKKDTGEEVTLRKIKENEPIYFADQKDFPIEKGKSYSLQVEALGYPSVYSTTTIPLEKAVWKSFVLYPVEFYYQLKGTWDALSDESEIDYNVSITTGTNDHILNQADNKIIKLFESYEVQQEVYFSNNAPSQKASLITMDKKTAEFRGISGLTFEMFMHFQDAYFTDLISGFKGVMPQGGNITNGHGIFGGYLMDSKTVYNPKYAN